MKRVVVLMLAGILALASCENDFQQEALPSPTSVDESISSSATREFESEMVSEEYLSPVAVDTPAPIDVANTPDPNNVIENGRPNADVLFVKAQLTGDSTWTFTVTVEHSDTGWEDYADGWDVVLPDGEVIKPDPESSFTRLLLHPHETEQPFTRSQSGIRIPPGIERVTVRAHDLVHGFGGEEVVVDLSAASGPGFEVGR